MKKSLNHLRKWKNENGNANIIIYNLQDFLANFFIFDYFLFYIFHRKYSVLTSISNRENINFNSSQFNKMILCAIYSAEVRRDVKIMTPNLIKNIAEDCLYRADMKNTRMAISVKMTKIIP